MFEELLRRIREVQNFPDGPVALHAPVFAGNEKRYAMDAIESTFVSSVGEYVTRFEEMLCSLTAHGMPWLAATAPPPWKWLCGLQGFGAAMWS